MIITAVMQIEVMHLLLFSLGRRSKFSSGVWDTSEMSKTALILLEQADEPTLLSFGASALNNGLSPKGRVINTAGQGL